MTKKILEYLFERQIIEILEYSSGIRFRDFHRIKFRFADGLPKLNSSYVKDICYSYESFSTKDAIEDIEIKYNLMAKILKQYGVFDLVHGICVKNEFSPLLDHIEYGQLFFDSSALKNLKFGLIKISDCF